MKIDRLGDNGGKKRNARLDKAERIPTGGHASVSTGTTRFVGLEAIKVEGTGRVTGTLYVDGTGADGSGGRIEVSGTISGDGLIDWDGTINNRGSMHSYGGGRLIVSETGNTAQSMQIIAAGGAAGMTAFGIPMHLIAWASAISLREDSLYLQHGVNGSIEVHQDFTRLRHGDSVIEQRGDLTTIRNGDGPWIELKNGKAYWHGLPVTDSQPNVVVAADEQMWRTTWSPPDPGGGTDPGGEGPESVVAFYAESHWGDLYGATEGRPNPHRGHDFNGYAEGTAIPAMFAGEVVLAEWDDALGNVVTIQRSDGVKFGYSHLQSASPLAVGQTVAAGDNVGAIGDTGSLSFGAHLHFTASTTSNAPWTGAVIDPTPYIRAAIGA